MKPEKQRIAIAEMCGWTHKTRGNCYEGIYRVWLKHGRPSDMPPPDYPNDLNAMHEAVNGLTVDQRMTWLAKLDGITLRDNSKDCTWYPSRLLAASARQWAEAFLRTIGKWEDE